MISSRIVQWNAMKYLRAVCGFVLFAVLASNVWSMSRWSESRGVYDDICYLRQAHLFQRFGLGGFDTNISRDDDHYLSAKLKEMGFASWNDPATAPCHTLMSESGKRVMQYPPGTGLALALFPEGFQVIPLYVSATVIVFGLALLAIFYARSRSSVLLTAGLGCLGRLSDDQSCKSQLFGGADHGGLCVRGTAHGELLLGRTAAASTCPGGISSVSSLACR